MFTTIFVVLLVLLLIYYGVMIAIDLGKADAAEKSNVDNEVEIDISEELSEFKPVEISRRQPTEIRRNHLSENRNFSDIEQQEDQYFQATHFKEEDIDSLMETLGNIPEDLRKDNQATLSKEPLMTDGLDVGQLLACVEELASKGNSPLGDIIYECQQHAA